MTTQYVSQSQTFGTPIYHYQEFTNNITTSANGTWVATGLSITPPIQGTYLCLFSASMLSEGGASVISEIDVQVNGVTLASSTRQARITVTLLLGIVGSTFLDAGASNCMVLATVDGTQPITVRFRKTGTGTNVTIGTRSLTLIKVG